IVTVSRPVTAGVPASAIEMWVVLVKTNLPAARLESVRLGCHFSAAASIGPSSESPHGVAGSSQRTHQMWNRSARWIPVYVHVNPPALPRLPVGVHARPNGGNASSFGVSCESAQPALLTGAPCAVPGHLSLPSGTLSPSESHVSPHDDDAPS